MPKIITGIKAERIGDHIHMRQTWGKVEESHTPRFVIWGREPKYENFGGPVMYNMGAGFILKPDTLFWRTAAWFKRHLTG